MIIPSTVTILGRKFKVRFKDREELAKIYNKPGSAPDAMLTFSKRRILISNDMNEEDTVVGFLHECNHAIDYITGFSQTLDYDKFEISAETRANGFYDVFKCLCKLNQSGH